MNRNNHRGIKLVFVLAISILLQSCGGTVFVNASHSRNQVKDKVLPLVAGKSVALENYYTNSKQVTIFEGSNSTRLKGDLQQYTDATLNILKSELTKRDVIVSDTGFKTINLKISDVQATNKPFNKTTSVKLTVSLGNGKSSTITANYQTAGSSAQSLDGAIIAAITQLLKSEFLVGYINQ
ncbi:hypothetical protein MNBD_GAMMA21-2155 [hydrothermal vent metagenome]|uniref:Lipoprotein n=1 Tax=hydrothermal vent metagenome TaxID=652676 RepID=A0A3B1AH42_9ZZZZ